MESSIINSVMLVQIAILAWIFLGEKQDARQMLGLLFAVVGVVVVQIRINGRSEKTRMKNKAHRHAIIK
jgi:drug/metabolite transporter (DMT)-like permease